MFFGVAGIVLLMFVASACSGADAPAEPSQATAVSSPRFAVSVAPNATVSMSMLELRVTGREAPPPVRPEELSLLMGMINTGQLKMFDWQVENPVTRADSYQIYSVSGNVFFLHVNLRPPTGSTVTVYIHTDYHAAFTGNTLFAIVDNSSNPSRMIYFLNKNVNGERILSLSNW